MHPPEEPGHDGGEFAASLGALLRGAERSSVELRGPQAVAGARDGYRWTVEISRVEGTPPSDGVVPDRTHRSTGGGDGSHPLERSRLGRSAFVATLGALLRSAERSGVELTGARNVAGLHEGSYWMVEISTVESAPGHAGLESS